MGKTKRNQDDRRAVMRRLIADQTYEKTRNFKNLKRRQEINEQTRKRVKKCRELKTRLQAVAR